jgi:hypothetical protein
MPEPDGTLIVIHQAAAGKPLRRRVPATIHRSVNYLSFAVANLALWRKAQRDWRSRSASGEPVADRERAGPPKFRDTLDARRCNLADGMGNTFAVGAAGESESE